MGDIFWGLFCFVLIAAQAYLLGSISFAIIVTRLTNKTDIRAHGSGNAGMTNVLRTAGKLPAALTLAGDLSKAVVAVLLGRLIAQYIAGVDPLFGAYIAGFFCIIGHIFPLYFHFKGGKGVLTAAGMVLIIDWRILLVCLAVFLVVLLINRRISLASICAAAALPVIALFVYLLSGASVLEIVFNTIFSALIGCVIIIMHRDNIRRLLAHTEPKIGQKL